MSNGADILAVNSVGDAPVHIACKNMSVVCLDLLVHHKDFDPNQQDGNGDTILHILCRLGKVELIHTLLLSPGLNPQCVNHAGETPLELAKADHVLQMMSVIVECNNKPVETYIKIFVLGNSGTGKSTLIKAVTTEASQLLKFALSSRAKLVNPSEVPPLTAGIVPIPFISKHFGHAVLYDFAGQHEYYSSHAAVLENLILPSPPLFLVLIDISKPLKEIKDKLLYWWQFINNHSQQAKSPPHAILVGSHKDIAKANGENPQKIIEQALAYLDNVEVTFHFKGTFLLDCRQLVSHGLTSLLTQLNITCNTLRESADISLYCHILKEHLTSGHFDQWIACKVSDITDRKYILLPLDGSQLIPLLSTLSDKGHILLLENKTDVDKSWVILKPEVLLKEVCGSIFAPENFKEYSREFALSTGVVTLAKITEAFKTFDHEIITGYLTHMEYCFQIRDQHTLEMITNDPKLQLLTQQSSEKYYFFPGLVKTENPTNVYSQMETVCLEYGWLYRCGKETEQLTSRFLHVLILRLAFSCEHPDNPTEIESVVLLRSCSVWKHGIAWSTNDGIETIVEVGLQCRWVAVMMRCPNTHKVQCAELRSQVISTVLKTKRDFCPAITMKEFLIAPSSLKYPFEENELTIYSMKEIARAINEGKVYVKDVEGNNLLNTRDLLPFEPYFNMGNIMEKLFCTNESLVHCELVHEDIIEISENCYKYLRDFEEALKPKQKAYEEEFSKTGDSQVSRCIALFQILQRRGCKTWRDFEHEFSRFSIFCGRNPMVWNRNWSYSSYEDCTYD